jgi:hypothetical protein
LYQRDKSQKAGLQKDNPKGKSVADDKEISSAQVKLIAQQALAIERYILNTNKFRNQ